MVSVEVCRGEMKGRGNRFRWLDVCVDVNEKGGGSGGGCFFFSLVLCVQSFCWLG